MGLFLIMQQLTAANATTIEELEHRAQISLTKKGGREFAKDAIQSYWANPDFMYICAPPESPPGPPLDIFIVITPSGNIGDYVIFPNNSVATCIMNHTKNLLFNHREDNFTLKIRLDFK